MKTQKTQKAKHATIPPSHLKVLAAILEAHAAARSPSFREILARLGWSRASLNAVQQAVNRLADAGLVTWDHGLKRTLRPTCRFEPA